MCTSFFDSVGRYRSDLVGLGSVGVWTLTRVDSGRFGGSGGRTRTYGDSEKSTKNVS